MTWGHWKRASGKGGVSLWHAFEEGETRTLCYLPVPEGFIMAGLANSDDLLPRCPHCDRIVRRLKRESDAKG